MSNEHEAQLTALMEEVTRIKKDLSILELEISVIEEGMSTEFLAALTTIKRAEKRLSEVREDLEILSDRKTESP